MSFTDDAGNEESLTSTATATVAARPNAAATGAPTVSGTAQVGETLTASTSGIADADGLTNATFSYQWLRDDTGISGATSSTYTLADADEGKTIKVRVSFTDDAGNEESLISSATDTVTARSNAAATGAPTVTGTPRVGETLTASTSDIADADGLTNTTFIYQWLADDTSISGAAGSTHTLTGADEGKTIKVRVSFTDDAGNEESLTSAATSAVTVLLTASVHDVPASHDGSAGFEFELHFSPEPSISYRTLRDHALTVTGGELTKTQRKDTGSNLKWIIGVKPSGNGDVTVTLTATTDCDAEDAICTKDGEMLSNTVEVTVPGPDSHAGTPNAPATGAPAVTGTARVGETLTASTSDIADADGLTSATFSYRWLRDDADISGATGSTYTLADADEGKAIKVRVSFTDDAGNEESLTSAVTATVAARPNRPATGAPTISGTAQVGETLTVTTTGIADADGLTGVTFAYQWLADDTDISDATGSTYTLAAADEGKAIKVRVSFTDDRGHQESLTSAATSAVAASTPPVDDDDGEQQATLLTASAHDVPSSHDGSAGFEFELHFSPEPSISYRTLRDHALTVTGGELTKTQRKDTGSNLKWIIGVKPSGNGDVTVTLPATTDCDDESAICTSDGLMLSNTVEVTVSGPSS